MSERASEMTRQEAADALGLSTHRVDQLRFDGTLTTVRYGTRGVRVTADSVSREISRRKASEPVTYDHSARSGHSKRKD